MTKREAVMELSKKYSFEKSYAILQLATEDGEYDNNEVHVELKAEHSTDNYLFTVDWREDE